MTSYLIDCVNTKNPHSHIVSAKVKEWNGTKYEAVETMTVGTIRTKITAGNTFETYSPSTQKLAKVKNDNCKTEGCNVETIRSEADAVTDNNLDNKICK